MGWVLLGDLSASCRISQFMGWLITYLIFVIALFFCPCVSAVGLLFNLISVSKNKTIKASPSKLLLGGSLRGELVFVWLALSRFLSMSSCPGDDGLWRESNGQWCVGNGVTPLPGITFLGPSLTILHAEGPELTVLCVVWMQYHTGSVLYRELYFISTTIC